MALTAKKVYAILKRQISNMEAKLNSPVRYKGTVATADLLPLNPDIGDMYNIESKSVYGEAGMNVAWNGVVWDTMGAPIDMSLYLKEGDIPEWALQPEKPTYTAEETGALPADTKIPTKVSELENDSDYVTQTIANETYQPKGKYLTTVPVATTEALGAIKPDGKTTFIDDDGTLHAKGGGATITPKPVNNPTIENGNASVIIKWQDPENTVINGSTFSTWLGTKLVMKETGYPANPDDGTLVILNLVRDKYKTTGYTVTGLTNGKKYYFALFPYNTDHVYNYDAGNRLLGEPEDLKIVTFADGTDDEITKMIEAHYAGKININDYWAVGDKRTIHHNAMAATGVSESHKENDYVYVIIGIEHDDLVTAINGKTKAAITIQTERMLYLDTTSEYNDSYDTVHEYGYMNSSNTNSNGWEGCARREWCNTVYKQCLPTYIQNMMKQVKKLTSAGSQNSTIKTSNDYAFLTSEIEVFGSRTYSFAGEGKQYQYFKNIGANRYKEPRYASYSTTVSTYASGMWWERSPLSSNGFYFCGVNEDGNAGYYSANIARGVAPCLCI